MFKDLFRAFTQGLLLRKDPVPAPDARHGFARRNIEGFALAIAMALVIKQFVIDTFQVPTESMEPTIIGRQEWGDRILVDRLDYLGRDPERYDIVVFRYPLSRQVNYVKRAVGMPGESLEIWNGQILAGPRGGARVCTRKPDAVQESIFEGNPVVPEADVEDLDVSRFARHWRAGGAEIKARDGGVAVVAPAKEERLFDNKFAVTNARTDPYAADAEGKQGGAEACGDVRFDVKVRPEAGAEAALLEIVDPSNAGRALRLELALEGSAAPSTLLFGREKFGDAALAAVRLKPGAETRVVFDNVDQRVTVTIDGKRVFRRDYDVAPGKDVGLGQATRLKAGARGGAVGFTRLAVFRDLHYSVYPTAPTAFDVPEGSYLMFGDNSPNSLDARGWRSACIRLRETGETLWGDAEAVSDRIENQRRRQNPWTGDDGVDRFLDVYGNEIKLEPGAWDLCDAATGKPVYEAVRSVGDVPDPQALLKFDHYVPRRYVVGRAKFTFFPVQRAGVLR
ncbi:MAG TPA: signal peptidase I [Planctomycetota bacterium]|nr:signal peptidase I [Planctomycetota bacterium]